MTEQISVMFSTHGTVASTICSIESLIRQIPNYSAFVVSISFEDQWLKINFEEGAGTITYDLIDEGRKISLNLKSLDIHTLKIALKRYISHILNIELKSDRKYDVNNIEVIEDQFILYINENPQLLAKINR